MSKESSNYTPNVCFYIGANDSDDEEGFDCETFSASYISKLTQIWNDISTWEDGYKPPLQLAIKILRILQGLRSSPRESKQTVGSYNAALNRRISKVSTALQEYKELLCAQVFFVLEEREELEFSEIKEEIKQIKTEIEHAKLLSYQKNHQVHKKLDCGTDDSHLTSREKEPDTESLNKEEEKEDDTCTVECLRKFSRRK